MERDIPYRDTPRILEHSFVFTLIRHISTSFQIIPFHSIFFHSKKKLFIHVVKVISKEYFRFCCYYLFCFCVFFDLFFLLKKKQVFSFNFLFLIVYYYFYLLFVFFCFFNIFSTSFLKK